MTGGTWYRLDQIGRSLTPAAVTVLLVLLGMVPLHLPSYGTITPAFGLMAVYYWAVHRPDLLRPVVAFAVGLLHDLLSGAPLGLNALIYVLTHGTVLMQRRFFLDGAFVHLWLGFVLIALGAALVQWLANSLLHGALLAPAPALFQALQSIALFPVLSWLFMRLHRAVLNRP